MEPMGEERRSPNVVLIVLLCIVLGFGGGMAGGFLVLRSTAVAPDDPAVGGGSGGHVTNVSQLKVLGEEDAVVQATERVNPAVVTVVATKEAPRSIEDFFFGPVPRQGMGSGFAFEFEGHTYVLTNTHVITLGTNQLAQQVNVILHGGQEVAARVVGCNTDEVAVLELSEIPSDLPVASLGDSETLRPGQTVIAIGNPFGFEHTVTTGVVSAVGPRNIQGHEFSQIIQTDAPINEGNSGGPLVDLGGNVIGMNTAIFSPTGGSVGIGFAIPVSVIKNSLPLLINKGPWIGVAMWPMSQDLARRLNLTFREGVLVWKVVQGGPADRGGVLSGDVIMAVNEQKVTRPEDVIAAVSKVSIGGTVNVTVVHADGQRATLSVTTAKIPTR